MSFSKNDLDKIKAKIPISKELEKKTKIVQKGKDYWCCCPFHDEKTPSCKINNDQGSFYCFGCGAKGDIFTLYTDLYNYNFIDALKELSQRAGVQIDFKDKKKTHKESKIFEILKISSEWYQKNLNLSVGKNCKEYLVKRNLSEETIAKFKLGYSFNSQTSLYDYLKNKNFSDDDLIKSNIVKLDKNNKIRDYFYKRLIFPISNNQGHIVGFGGRALDNSNPKYINSPESEIFQKRFLLYNLDLAKNTARKKNNLLICEGYMDVISLYQNGIHSVVAPLGTAITENQLELAWRYSSKPTIMFDGDSAGLRASYKTAVMSLPLISSKQFLQFLSLPEGSDPDSFINNNSLKKFINLLKNPESLVNYIFSQSSKSIKLTNADEKISYDKYLDELIEKIKDKKINYFYKNELKSLFFDKIRKSKYPLKRKNIDIKRINTSIHNKQIFSFIAVAINHLTVRTQILDKLLISSLINIEQENFIKKLKLQENINYLIDDIYNKFEKKEELNILKDCLNSKIYQLFPYSDPKFDPQAAYEEVEKSLNNLNTRLLNLKKINKSLDTFINNSNTINWSELQNINLEINDED